VFFLVVVFTGDTSEIDGMVFLKEKMTSKEHLFGT
jgi:hypothetical protein